MFTFTTLAEYTVSKESRMKKLNPRLMVVTAAALLAGAICCQADASTTLTTTFQVSLTITSSCVISANPLNFGSSGVLNSTVAQTTQLSVTCTNTTPYVIGLDAGNATGSTVNSRLLSSGTANVSYQLYSDSGRTAVWGNTTGTNTVSGTGSGSAQAMTVYGLVPTQTTPAAGSYVSTVTMSVTF
jgi:spore coat protein U-like protein